MTWLQSIIIAVLTGSLGLLCGGLVMAGCVRWHNVSHFEGRAAYDIIGVALLGGIAAFIAGLVTARVIAAGVSPTFLKGLGAAAGIVIGCSAIAAGLGWLTGDPRPRIAAVVETAADPAFEENTAARIAQEEAGFDAIPADAPIKAWLDMVATEEQQAVVLQRVTAKTGWMVELAELMTDDDPRLAEAALRFVGHLPQPPPELIPAVSVAGKQLADQLRKVNATTVEQDPRYEGAADVSIRFTGWMVAVRALRGKCGGDFVPELIEILELSRIRDDSHVMRNDIRRVASHYANKWAGLKPLPSDPPPH